MAKPKNFLWVPGDPPPLIEAHSLAKLDVLHGYLSRYIETLGILVKMPVLRLDVVDGFAGGGQFTDKQGNVRFGSPLTFLRSIEAARIAVGEKRGRPLEIEARYFFVDSDKHAIEYLRRTLIDQGFKDAIGVSIYLINAEFSSVYEKIVGQISARSSRAKAIFLLDQFGYSDAPLDSIAYILRKLPRSEIILNFATDSLLAYLNTSTEFRQALRKAGISESILEDDQIVGKHKGWRFLAERELSAAIKHATGSKFYTPFYIVSEESHRAYWLVHLCMHPKAHDEMIKTHWDVGNLFRHYGGPGTKMHMWGYNARNDPGLSGILDFGFDDIDRNECIKALQAELPDLIYGQEEGTTFEKLANSISNNTVAWQDLIKEQLGFLQSEGELEIITPNGNQREAASRISDDDVLRRKRQAVFPFMKR